MERVIDKINGEEQGREHIIICGIHGNELAGVRAIQNVMSFIRDNNVPIKGNITALNGNIEAIKKEVRFVDKDLNRLWTEDYISRKKSYENIHEIKELKELNSEIENICSGDYKNCVILDFHSFTADSGIFAIPADNEKSVELAKVFQVQFVEKLTSNLKETLIQYFAFKGATAVVFEGGQHFAKDTQKNIEAGAYLALTYLGAINKDYIPNYEYYKKMLQTKALDLPKHFKLSYIHRIKNGNIFKMNPGYVNFQRIKKGEVLATENGKNICSQFDGTMLMPLYQKQGTNGFYIIQEN